MTPFLKESDLEPHVAQYLRRRGCSRQQAQVPFYDRRIDIMALGPTGMVIAVECKLTKWRNALSQALLYQLCSDLVFVALPKEAASCVDRDRLVTHGVGLLAISRTGEARMLCKPRKSEVVRPDYRRNYARVLRDLNGKKA